MERPVSIFARFILILILSVMAGCTSFMIPGDAESLKPLEQGTYQIKKDIINNGLISLEANTVVRLVLEVKDSWIKVYAYRAGEDLLVADRYLAIYLFQDDFPNKKFNREDFDKKFNEFLKPFTGEIPKAKAVKAKDAPGPGGKGMAPPQGKQGDKGAPPPRRGGK